MEAAEKLLGKDDLFDPEERDLKRLDSLGSSRWLWNAMDKEMPAVPKSIMMEV